VSRTEGRLHALSPEEQRAELAQLLLKRQSKQAPLSFAQERIWFLHQLEPEGAAWNMPLAVRLTGPLDVTALQHSLDEIARRHETLRTTFSMTDGGLAQEIAPAIAVLLHLIDLRDEPPAEREAKARQLVNQEAQRSFDLARGPLFRTHLVRLSEQEHVLLLNVHHIVSDGWSQAVLVREFTQFYDAFARRHFSPLPSLPLQYADFAQWQRQSVGAEGMEQELAYWKRQLAAPLPSLGLIPDHYDSTSAPQLVRETLTLPHTLGEALKTLGRQEQATLFMVLVAALKTLLYRYTSQTDLIVGSPIANRNRAELEGMIGVFINTLVLRTDLSGDPSFVELLGRVRRTVLDAFANKNVSFEQIVQAVQPQRDLSRNPLFEVVFILQGEQPRPPDLPGIQSSMFPIDIQPQFPDMLGIAVWETEEALVSILEYRTDLLSARIASHWQTLLEGIVAHPQQHLSALPILSEAEQYQLLAEWNNTGTDYATDQCIHELFEAQAAQTPDAVAVVFDDEQLTYQELNQRANQLAHHARKLGVGPDVLVGICAERSVEMVIGLLGILKAGGAYVPLEPTYPVERLALMLEDACAPVLLTLAKLAPVLPTSQAHAVSLDTDWDQIAQQSTQNPASQVTGHNLAYVIYTSGSTGEPKGAMNTHAGIRNRLLWMQETYQLTAVDRVMQKTPFSFDVSVWEFFWPLLTGACLVVARPEGHKDSAYLVRTIVEQKVTTLHFVPSMLQMFVEDPEVEMCRSLKRVICSGEALPFDLQERFFARLDAELHNLYGPTEAAVDVTCWACERESRSRTVPIGRPIANTQIYLLDSNLRLVPMGVPGELHIGGVGLGRGYLNRPDLTAERFIPNPFTPPYAMGGDIEGCLRLYKTGDLARYRPDGNIEFLGRMDYQVKVHGHRIELGGIEAVLEQHPTVRKAVVVVRGTGDEPDDKRLAAYIVAQDPALALGDLRDWLRAKLPDYMVPSDWMMLPALPLTPSGKIDRKALPAPDVFQPERLDEYVAPETPVEEKLAEIWAQILHVEQVGIYDNFFNVGGHSLLATQVIRRINKTFSLNLSVDSIFDEPTIAGLALLIEENLLEEIAGQKQ
jgi:amino acid adenylation domain-containing protein